MTLKRLVDVAGAVAGLMVAGPLMAVIAALLRLRLGAPVLFRQERPGLNGQPFTIHKFRTMRDGPGEDAERLERLGRLLRATSLDELPELFDVLRGPMSLVGPRPLLMEYLDRYTPEQARRHEVKPGITGWAQVNGRNRTTWEQRLAMDVWYVEHRCLRVDLAILARTLGLVLRRAGITAEGHATMPNLPDPRDS